MSLLDQVPRLRESDAARLAGELYGLEGRISLLASERDQNFLLDTPSGRFVLKIANATDSADLLGAQNAALRHLASHPGICPVIVSDRDGRELPPTPDGHFVRLVRWIPGVPLAEVKHRSRALLDDLGARMGEVNAALAGFDHPALYRDFHWDLRRAPDVVRRWVPLVGDAAWRDTLSREVDGIEQRLSPLRLQLREAIVHNDANDHNILVDGAGGPGRAYQRVSGVLDVGDMLYSLRASDAAVLIAYAVLGSNDPLAVATTILAGYHRTSPLDDVEIAALFDLVRLRLCLSVAIAAHQQPQRPGDAYLGVSQQAIRTTLPALAAMHPRFVEAAFRGACGLPISPRASRVVAWLQSRPHTPPPLVQPLSGSHAIVPVSLGVASPLVSGDPAANVAPLLSARIAAAVGRGGGAVGAGGYLEARTLYDTPLFAGAAGERRTIHLGVDFFAPAGSLVTAPLDGVVHAIADNRQPLDYGPVAIVRHESGDGDEFFTIYGHLSRESLTRLAPGTPIRAAVPFASLGSADVNGGWTPHLHFQIATDLLDLATDYPGVCRPGEAAVWSALCPDPNLVTRISGLDDRGATVGAQPRPHVGPGVRTSYQVPLQVARGWMQYLYDTSGRQYLDGYNNVPHVGHSHPAVVEAVAAQLGVLNTNTRYLHRSLEELAARLAATLPAGLDVCYFVNSGSEANEVALRLARAHTGRRDMIVLEAAYHGNTTTLIDISPYKFDGPGGGGKSPWVHVAPLPDPCRGRYAGQPDAVAAVRYADEVGRIADALLRRGSGPAAFVAETCPSVGGQILLPDGYLAHVYRHVRRAGGVCIADEVQTAYGRMGTHFYAFEAHGVVPDIVVLGKPIGNGYPLGAVVTTADIAASFDNGMEFFSTFGGSTTACAAGLAVLDVVLQEALQAHARTVGEVMLRRLRETTAASDRIADVRGSGLFAGIEVVTDRQSMTPDAVAADYIVNRLREERILIGTDGPHHNVLKIRPPMPFGADDADHLAIMVAAVLGELP